MTPELRALLLRAHEAGDDGRPFDMFLEELSAGDVVSGVAAMMPTGGLEVPSGDVMVIDGTHWITERRSVEYAAGGEKRMCLELVDKASYIQGNQVRPCPTPLSDRWPEHARNVAYDDLMAAPNPDQDCPF